ncbi:sugar ABC transporter ATP-binding protein [Streptomyces sp. NBC_01356]|uniref:sugar ABC transporter ATP-binding protein n=1 Tax=Streptomyces sp. NBC_01356 TaxID=2903836 RepID=UPI002E309D52|nr:sugar ABC transporter ATP-binding protein [Streptomyces sp. NBC_01356]
MSAGSRTDPPDTEPPHRLEVAELSKAFGSTRALRGVHLRITRGELHGLVGQNGCGKSTLVKILTGVYAPDPGASIAVDGQQLALPVRPMQQREAGVSVVHQNSGLVDDLAVWENVRLGHYRAGRLSRRINRREEQRATEQVLARLGRPLEVGRQVGQLSAEDRAVVAIARAVQDHRPGGGLIVFDESTRALGRSARARFFELVRSLVDEGTSVLLISHQLEEVVEATDRVTVLRDGAVVEAGLRTSEVDEVSLTRMMLGRHLVTHGRVGSQVKDEVVASARGLVVGSVTGLDLDIRRGEILGLTGLIGSGFVEVAEALAGARPAGAGTLSVHGRDLALDRKRGCTEEFVDAGVAFVPERRLEAGVAGELSVADNLTLPRVRGRGSRLRTGSAWQAEETAAMIAKLDIRPPHPQAPVHTLSGGNQQKVLLGKWLAGAPNLLVLHEPTQAVDVGARHDIIDAIREAARDGCGIILASIDPVDLAVLCDRVLVFRDGKVAQELSGELEQDAIVHAVFGDDTRPQGKGQGD